MLSAQRGIISFVIALLIIAGVSYFIFKNRYSTNQRYAVLMSTGQVYFGYITADSADFLTLDDVYYTRLTDITNAESGTGSKKITLTKLGQEAYTPENTINLNKRMVVNFSPIKDGSKITDAINEYQREIQSPTPGSSPVATPSS